MTGEPPGACAAHPDLEATFTCARCGDFGCAACEHRVTPNASPLCSACWSAREQTVRDMESRERAWLPKLALGLGVAALIPCIWPLQIGAIVLGVIALRRAESDGRGRALGIAAALLGVIGLAGSALLFFFSRH